MAPDMKQLRLVLILFLVLLVGVLFYTNRANLIAPYDAQYWKDRFEHSQWQLPLSPRTIGDNGLYAYEGYELAHGANPTTYNAEIPPLGKYAIGAVIRLTGNSYWYGVISAIMAAVLFYLLANKILKNTTFALVATTWFVCDPLFISQWPATMLDSMHLVFLLLFFILLFEYGKRKRTILYVVLPGVALGAFSAIKYPVLSVILVAMGCYYMWQKRRSILHIIMFLVSAGATYILTYGRYFLMGHTLLDWLRVQKWMFAFYANSRLESNVGSIWTTLLTNHYQNLFTKMWQTVPEWSIAWPIVTLSGFLVLYRLLRQNNKQRLFFLTMSCSVVLIAIFYTFTPFWTRYLLLIMPFLYMATASVLKTMKTKLVIVLCTLGLITVNSCASWRIIFPTPEADIRQFTYDWQQGFFQDMYERFTVGAKAKEDRYVFHRDMQGLMQGGEVEAIDISIPPITWKRFVSLQYVSLVVTYSTRHLGKFTETIRLPVVNERGLWRIPWQPHYVVPELAQGDTLKTTVVPARRGAIRGHDGEILAEDVLSFMIWITPKLVDTTKETVMLKYLETTFGFPRYSAVEFYHRYSINSQPDWPVPVAVLPALLDQSARLSLLSYPGISLTTALGRFQLPGRKDEIGVVKNTQYLECCSALYTTTTYDGISGLEEIYNAKLKGQNGGSLVIVDRAGKIIRTLIDTEKIDGEDVLL